MDSGSAGGVSAGSSAFFAPRSLRDRDGAAIFCNSVPRGSGEAICSPVAGSRAESSAKAGGALGFLRETGGRTGVTDSAAGGVGSDAAAVPVCRERCRRLGATGGASVPDVVCAALDAASPCSRGGVEPGVSSSKLIRWSPGFKSSNSKCKNTEMCLSETDTDNLATSQYTLLVFSSG